MIKKDVVDAVLKKFLADPRHPPYLDNPKYAHLKERNKEIYLSSAYYKDSWAYDKCISYFKEMMNDKKRYFVCGLPYQLSIREGLYMAEQAIDEMTESTFNEVLWSIEMCALFWG